jgi:hypothetical protein
MLLLSMLWTEKIPYLFRLATLSNAMGCLSNSAFFNIVQMQPQHNFHLNTLQIYLRDSTYIKAAFGAPLYLSRLDL